MSATCSHCGKPVPEEGPRAGVCFSCLLGGEDEDTVMGGDPLSGFPKVDGHLILEEIACGGMGVVYKAQELEPYREVALKMLLPFDERREDIRERFRVEIHALAELDHPGILPLYDVGTTEGRPWFTMKLAAGGSLASRLGRRHKPFAPRDAATLVAKMADALQHAHSHGFLHRDIKPANILFDERGEPFLADFGLAKLLDATEGPTRSLAVLGTPCYIAPEIAAAGAKGAVMASDVYGLGAVLYELLSGRPPFIVQGLPALLKKIVEDEPERPSTLSDNVPRDLELVCLTCLAKDPRKRYSTAKDAADDLRRWLKGEPVSARRAGRGARLWAWAKRRPALAAVSAALILTVLGSAVWLTVSNIRLEKALADITEARTRADEQSEFLIGRFADKLEEMGRLSLIEEACAEAEKYDRPVDDAGFKRRARLLLRWAGANWAKGDGHTAAVKLREALEVMSSVRARSPQDSKALILTIHVHCRLAEVLSETVTFDEAFKYLEEGAALIEPPGILRIDDLLRLQGEIARTHAGILIRLQGGATAVAPAVRAASFYRTLQAQDPGDTARIVGLARALRCQGEAIFYAGMGDEKLANETGASEPPSKDKALALFREGCEALQPVMGGERYQPEVEYEFAQATGWKGAILRRQGPEKAAEALQCLEADQAIMTRLTELDALNWHWQFKLADADWALKEFYEDSGNAELVERYRKQRLDRLDIIRKQAPEVREWTLAWIEAKRGRGQSQLEAGDVESARRIFAEVRTAAVDLVKRQPDSRWEQTGWINLNYQIAEAWLARQLPEDAIAAYQEALRLGAAEIAAGNAALSWTWIAGEFYRRLAGIYRSQETPEGARAELAANVAAKESRAAALRSRFFRVVENPGSVVHCFEETLRGQMSLALRAEVIQTGSEALDIYTSCGGIAGPPRPWVRIIRDAVKDCIKNGGAERDAARLLAAKAAEFFFPPSQRDSQEEKSRKLLAELVALATGNTK